MTKDTISLNKPQNPPKNPPNGRLYSFLSRTKNPLFEEGLIPLEVGNTSNPLFESCLLTIKSDNFYPSKTPLIPPQTYLIRQTLFVRTEPKWHTNLLEHEYDKETGEILAKGVYQTNDFKVSNGKKIKKLDQFCNFYQPLYKARKVTLWFLTFTRANHSRLSFKQMNNIIKKYYQREGFPIRGFIWTYEISKDNLHWHYHICIATNRINVKGKGLPTKLMFDSLWGQRTEVDFVKKNIRHYMAKYFAKCNFRLNNKMRSYGCSKQFI
jgi:hypothetical protein